MLKAKAAKVPRFRGSGSKKKGIGSFAEQRKAATRTHNYCKNRTNRYLKNPYSKKAFEEFKRAHTELKRKNPADAKIMGGKVTKKMRDIGISEKDLR